MLVTTVCEIGLAAIGIFLAGVLVWEFKGRRYESALFILGFLGFLAIILGYREGSILPFIGLGVYGICFLGIYYLSFWRGKLASDTLEPLFAMTLVYWLVLPLCVPKSLSAPVFWGFVVLLFIVSLSMGVKERKGRTSNEKEVSEEMHNNKEGDDVCVF